VRPIGGRIGRLAVPIRVLAQRFALLILIGASIALMIAAKGEHWAVERVRTTVMDIVAPVLDVISRPAQAVNDATERVGQFILVYRENERLREENERLRSWQSTARRLETENAAFRALLRARPEPGVTYVAGRVIGDSGGPWVRTVALNAGETDGVRKGSAVVTGDGLVGRVVEAGDRSSRILLLTDLNSRVPVVVESSRYRAILEGDNTDTLKLSFVIPSDDVRIGDRIVTSGSGGLFPAGLPIGDVTAIKDGTALVTPFVRFDRLEYVRVLRFDFPGMNAEGPPARGR
jgi:rod shape-determining protein MreC